MRNKRATQEAIPGIEAKPDAMPGWAVSVSEFDRLVGREGVEPRLAAELAWTFALGNAAREDRELFGVMLPLSHDHVRAVYERGGQ